MAVDKKAEAQANTNRLVDQIFFGLITLAILLNSISIVWLTLR